MKLKSLYLFSILALLFSCTNTSTEDLIDDTPPPQVVTFDADVAPIIQSQCVNCHNANFQSGGLNLEGYQNVRVSTENGNLIDRITRQPGDPLLMPQGMQLPQNSINLIIQWEIDGFLEN